MGVRQITIRGFYNTKAILRRFNNKPEVGELSIGIINKEYDRRLGIYLGKQEIKRLHAWLGKAINQMEGK